MISWRISNVSVYEQAKRELSKGHSEGEPIRAYSDENLSILLYFVIWLAL